MMKTFWKWNFSAVATFWSYFNKKLILGDSMPLNSRDFHSASEPIDESLLVVALQIYSESLS